VALVSSIDGGELCAHQTFLARDGSRKAPVDKPRLFPKGASIVGAGVWFGTGDADSEFIVGEGVESTLSALRLTAAAAGCAALSWPGLMGLVLPRAIRRVRIMADHDGAGLDAAHAAARRWRGEGLTVRVSRATQAGRDANDLWLSRLREHRDD
jgi:hypothetical protein